MGKGGFFYLSFSFPVGRADAIASFAEGGSYASAFCFVVFYGCALVFRGEDFMSFPALRKMYLALTVLPLTVMSSLAMTAAVLPAVIRLPLVSSATVSAWSFHPVLPRLILIPTALFLLMALSVFCMSLTFNRTQS